MAIAGSALPRRSRRKAALSVALLLVVVAACSSTPGKSTSTTVAAGSPTSAPPTSSPVPTTSVPTSVVPTSLTPSSNAKALPPTNGFSVVVERWNWLDASRPTAAYRGISDRQGRALPTEVFLPAVDGRVAAANGPFPLFVWAHGIDATVAYFEPLLRAWTARGYVVAAPTFPLTHAGLPSGGDFNDYVNQPKDVSFVIDQLLAAYGSSGSAHRGLVDASRIAVGGHSLGAVTTIGLVANRCCIDSRVRAAVEIDGAGLPFPHGAATERGVPLLLIHGDADRTFPVRESRATYAASLPPKYLVVLRGMPHTPFANPAAYSVIVSTVGDFLDAYLKHQTGALPLPLPQLIRDARRPGLTVLTYAR